MTAERLNVVAASPSAFGVLGLNAVEGRLFDAGHAARRHVVGVIDTVAARKFGIVQVGAGVGLHVDGTHVTVVGIFEAPAGEPRLTGAIVVPDGACREPSGMADFDQPEVVIRTRLGATDQVGNEAAFALRPTASQALTVLVPPDLRSLRREVAGDTRALFLGLAAISLLIGTIGVGNTMAISVLERRSEIGVRRAVGATRVDIALQFLVESIALGIIGGTLGLVLGVDVTAALCLAKGWLIVLEPMLVALGPIAGMVAGVVAGVYPAYVATRISPATAIRG
jgi:putative ABC transport system permease protein